MKKMNETTRRAIAVCALSVLNGTLLALLRMNILFGSSYIPSTGLYPEGTHTSAFETGLIVLSLSLMNYGFLFSSRGRRYEFVRLPVAGTFAGGLAGFGMLALGVSVFISAKISGESLTRFDSILVILSLVCAASFLMEAFSGEEKLSPDGVSVLMLFRPICCLFISFYFYFDSTTVIHDSNKKMAILFFAAVLLSLLYEVKMRVTRARTSTFVILNALSLCYGIMYAVPGIVWYFASGEALVLSVFFDVAVLFLSVWCAVRLISLTSRTDTDGAEAPETAEAPEITEASETAVEQTECGSEAGSAETTAAEENTEEGETEI